MFIILALYLAASWYLGHIVLSRWLLKVPALLIWAGASLIGTLITVPITYLLSCLFIFTGEPLLWATTGTTILALVIGIRYRKRIRVTVAVSDIVLILFSIAFSTWMMFKTFHGDATGELFVGSNNVFDFGHALGIVRSFSWGINIPFTSPFQAGLSFFYHFFFYFYVAIWEYLGVPIVFALNVPSIISFSSLLIVIYYLPHIVFGQKKLAGWIAVFLTITHPTLAFWRYLGQKGISFTTLREIWRLQGYPFSGPFDGSVISIFTTLNNYVNQRHLAFAVAVGLLLYIGVFQLLEKRQMTPVRSIVAGIFTGLLFFWNMPVSGLVCISLLLLFVLHEKWKMCTVYALPYILIAGLYLFSFIYVSTDIASAVHIMLQGTTGNGSIPQSWTAYRYIWENLGVLPVAIALGWYAISKEKRIFAVPLVILFIVECACAGFKYRGFDQKFYSFLIIGANVIAAVGIYWAWDRRPIIWKFCATALFVGLTISGFMDLMVIKNEFAYPFVNSQIASLVSWIHEETPKRAVFVSFSDIIDPVVLGGRRNYFGFYGNIQSSDRSKIIRRIYLGDRKAALESLISYIVVPKQEKNDFPYVVDKKELGERYFLAYEDERYMVFAVR